MAEILKEWLSERLQRSIKWEANEFGGLMKNGQIIADVLRSYHVISDDQFYLIRSSANIDEIKSNWKLLLQWLRSVDIVVSDGYLKNIQEGKGSTLLRLFYQLFLHLDKRDRTNFIKRERKMTTDLVEKINNRFKVDKVIEEPESVIDDLSRPLLNEKHFIEWQQKKAKEIEATYSYMRHKYCKTMDKIKESQTPLQHMGPKVKKTSEKDKNDMDLFTMRFPCKFENYSYDKLQQLNEVTLANKESTINFEWARNYMDNLHTKMHKKSESEVFQKQLTNVLSGSLWESSVAEEETKLDTELAKKVMKLSNFEKQMCTQIMETKQQARNLVKNRIQAEKEFAEQRAQQFNQYLDNVKEEIILGVAEIDFEKQRQNMLHKKLYAEKMKRKRKHYYEICYDTVLSIIDYATKYAYYKRLIGDDIPNHFIQEWKNLYYKHQPIFDIMDPMEAMFKEHQDEPVLTKEEEVLRLELHRQEAMNDNDFKEYHNYSCSWTLDSLLPNYDPESEERKYEYLGIRVLGHVVYTLLEIKYPYPPQKLPADLPVYKIRAILCGLPDKSIIIPMQILLNSQKIHVVRLECAIYFCLRRFKTELIGCKDIELSFDKFTNATQVEHDKELIKSLKIEDDLLTKNSDAVISAVPGAKVFEINTKQTQTPKTLPEENITLSAPADLGRYAYEALSSGDSLTDHLLAAMIVEYLKDQNDINGFVIVNYPNTYRETQILEETFSGRAPPNEDELDNLDDVYLEESIVKHLPKEKDPYKELRGSKLVDDPHKKRLEKPFESYFTTYIKLKASEDILQEYFIWDLGEDNSELIERVYTILGINYSMYYEVLDKEFLAQICKYIIGDYVMPLKSYDRLFGENVYSLLDFPSSEDKRTKSKIVKPEVSYSISKDKLRRGSKKSKLSVISELGVVKSSISTSKITPDNTVVILENMPEDENDSNKEVTLEEVKILAGEEDWNYGELPIAEIIGVALAKYWQEVERIYISDMKQLLFSKRLQMNCLIPYTRFVKDKMEQIITLPSQKQSLVNDFQKAYNDFEHDWRDINVTKNEWHCRVKELQMKLYKICDERKIHAQQQRHILICDNWAMEELTAIVNTYISCMQAELNRSILTFQALHDFYFAMIKHSPPNDRLTSKELFKILKDTDETSGSKRGGEDKLYRQLKNAYQEMHLKNIDIDFSNNPFNMVIENNVKFATKVIKDTNDSYRSLISREYSEIAKMAPPTKKKDEMSSAESINAEEIFKENALKCIEEWTMGINGEMFRATLRMMALQYKCYRDLKLFNDHIYKTFTEIQNDINNYYLNEIKSVDRLCKYLQMAVEDGKKIPETLVLEHDLFIIEPNMLQLAPTEPLTSTFDGHELLSSIDFNIGQLARLRSQFKIVAPTGIILQQAFIYLLQDFTLFGKESCEGSLFPEAWKRIDTEQIPKLVYNLFGETVYVDCRDFLILCLNIRFPTVEELLEVRKRFRCIDLNSSELICRDDFISIEQWYENDLNSEDKCAQLRNNLIKHFLFELYETAEDVMNYSAFLLAFSKSANPIEGFATALSMATGKKMCFKLDECEEVVCQLIKHKQYRDECFACALKCTQLFLDKVITNVINTCEATTIIELEYTEPLPDMDKKGKRGKSMKAKNIESTQSARLPKLQKSITARSKTTQSATDVKTTYICKPCAEEIEVTTRGEEKSPDKEVVAEDEQKSEPREDENLSYAVSQSTIWNVLQVCLPWHFVLLPEVKETPYVEKVKKVMKCLENDTDNKYIYVCKFVTQPSICKMLHKVKKFAVVNLFEEVSKIML